MKRIEVPSIHTINDSIAGSNGLTAISTFAGGGGSSTGYKWAGFRVPVALEFVDKAAATYRANAPSTHVIEEDIRNVTAHRLLDLAGLDVGELDVLDGSPPCQAFSNAGLKDKGWGEVKQYSGAYTQQTDDLFFEYIRLIDGVRPKVFVAENVTGMVNGVAKGYFAEIYRRMESLGYRVAAQQVEGVRLGLPQRRQRIIFIGVRGDLRRDPVFPKPYTDGRFVSIREAFEDLGPQLRSDYDVLKDGTRTRQAWDNTDVLRDPGGCFRYAYQRLGWGDARYMWFRLPPNEPSPTVTAKVPTLCHWDEPRTLSIPEIIRVSSFPDDFNFGEGKSASFKARWERIGRAVPPLMMKRIGETIAHEILKKPIRPHYRLVAGVWTKVN